MHGSCTPTRPNGVLAPFWTNLTGVGAPGIYTAQVKRNGNTYFVAEWRLNVAGTTSLRVFQRRASAQYFCHVLDNGSENPI